MGPKGDGSGDELTGREKAVGQQPGNVLWDWTLPVWGHSAAIVPGLLLEPMISPPVRLLTKLIHRLYSS